MMAYFTHFIDRMAVRSALGFFLFGSLLFLTLLIGRPDILFGLTIAFLFFAFAVSKLLFLALVISLLKHPKEIEQHVLAMLFVFINYPIAGLYIYLLS